MSKNRAWVWKGMIFGVLLWVLMYVVFPYFNEKEVVEPGEHLAELALAIPAGILWGYYRFVVVAKKIKERRDRMNDQE